MSEENFANGKATAREVFASATAALAGKIEYVNGLNVFPVPDGDTGTNMVLTLGNGLSASEKTEDAFSFAAAFSHGVIHGARGNSGVILSSFLSGMLKDFTADRTVEEWKTAWKEGVSSAYAAVDKPTEGTMLTVLRVAGEKTEGQEYPTLLAWLESLRSFADEALAKTPEQLMILRESGVVDSGGAGVVILLDGVLAALYGRPIGNEAAPENLSSAQTGDPSFDLSAFGRNSSFPYGYCTEFCLQLTDGSEPFDEKTYRETLSEIGESLVVLVCDGKVKTHVHTRKPEEVLSFAHRFGEFLTLKIENMSVQHSGIAEKPEKTENAVTATEKASPRVELSPGKHGNAVSAIAVASDKLIKDTFFHLGVDVVITGEKSPSTDEFLQAFGLVEDSRVILVFPNNGNTILAAKKAVSLWGKDNVHVIESRSVADCYATIPMIDFATTAVAGVVSPIRAAVKRVYTVSVTRAVKDAQHGKIKIRKGDCLALRGNALLVRGKTPESVAVHTVETVMKKRDPDVVTFFPGIRISPEETEKMAEDLHAKYPLCEFFTVPTANPTYDYLISFE